MKSSRIEPVRIADATAGVEIYLNALRSPQGLRGPALGRSDASLRYAGPAFDLRLEGMLDAQTALFAATGDGALPAGLAADLKSLCAAQLANGAFRNSCFEHNPCEGGMPHEAALMAAGCRAARCLESAGEDIPAQFEQTLADFVEKRLLRDLWSRLLRTFNDWLQSDFQHYSTASVAACVELLAEYRRVDERPMLLDYLCAAADSLLALQRSDGPARGALMADNRGGAGVSLWATARALPALAAAAAASGDGRYAAAFDSAAAYAAGVIGKLPRNTPPEPVRGWSRGMALWGEMADACDACLRAGLAEQLELDGFVAALLEAQTPTGGFPTALSFRKGWRASFPLCGWTAKVYALLAHLHPAERGRFESREWQSAIRCGLRRAKLSEDLERIRIESARGDILYLWNKSSDWAQECRL